MGYRSHLAVGVRGLLTLRHPFFHPVKRLVHWLEEGTRCNGLLGGMSSRVHSSPDLLAPQDDDLCAFCIL